MLHWPVLASKLELPTTQRLNQALKGLQERLLASPERWLALLCATFFMEIGRVKGETGVEATSLDWLETWQVSQLLSESALALGLTPAQSQTLPTAVRALIAQQNWYEREARRPPAEMVGQWLASPDIQTLIGLHSHEGVLWFHKEGFETLVALMEAAALLPLARLPIWKSTLFYERVLSVHHLSQTLLEAAEKSGFKLEAMLHHLSQ